ncbi:hypothetical protein GCM10029992_37960 [Glycomyces albus]
MTMTETNPGAGDQPAEDDRADLAALREAMFAQLRELGVLRSERIADAFRVVPRHRFAPGAPLAEVYAARDAVVTKRDEHGVAISSVSAPEIQAFMLEQAAVEEGMRVLEIGSGGFNAALIAELVGPEGQVTTVDIDSDVTTRAAELLGATGYDRVEVVCADASAALPGDGQWDRIIVTVGAWDVPPAWTDRLAPGAGWWCRCGCGASPALLHWRWSATTWRRSPRRCAGSCRCRARSDTPSACSCCAAKTSGCVSMTTTPLTI